jgi:hypothetical protein
MGWGSRLLRYLCSMTSYYLQLLMRPAIHLANRLSRRSWGVNNSRQYTPTISEIRWLSVAYGVLNSGTVSAPSAAITPDVGCSSPSGALSDRPVSNCKGPTWRMGVWSPTRT